MGWRRNARSTDERTWLVSVFPKTGVGDSMFLVHMDASPPVAAALLSCAASLTADYIARQKVGGTNLSYYYIGQFALPNFNNFTTQEFSFVTSRVLELTHTSHSLKPWSEDLQHSGVPFTSDPGRRAILRAELDAFFACKYCLTRDELRYILDPANTHGPDYPTETFRGLKRNEIERYGEYRTQRLVLEAFDRLTRT